MLTNLLLIVLLAAETAEAGEQQFDKPKGPSVKVLALLEQATPATDAAELRKLAQEASALIPPQSPVAKALATIAASPDDAAAMWKAMSEVREDLEFQPLREASLPEGFPTYTPPGVIELKTYPRHRRAVAKQFFTLFAHITRNDIAMTAPVRMEFEKAKDGVLEQTSMAFFQGDPDAGEIGADPRDNNVETVEEEARTVISLGHRGLWTRDVIAAGEKRLRKWLEANSDYRASGNLIVMGYNSPMTPATRQFIEIQLPVEKAPASPTAEATP